MQSLLFESHLLGPTGLTISRYLRNLRLERAAELLHSGRSNVTEAALVVGFSSLSHFSKAFAQMSWSLSLRVPPQPVTRGPLRRMKAVRWYRSQFCSSAWPERLWISLSA